MRLTFLILDLSLDIVNGVRGLDIKSDGFAARHLDEDLNATQIVGIVLNPPYMYCSHYPPCYRYKIVSPCCIAYVSYRMYVHI